MLFRHCLYDLRVKCTSLKYHVEGYDTQLGHIILTIILVFNIREVGKCSENVSQYKVIYS